MGLFRNFIVFSFIAVLAWPIVAQAEEQKLSQSEDLKNHLPCKAPDGNYPWYLHQKDDQGRMLFSIVCKGEGRDWVVVIPAELHEALYGKEPQQ